MADDANHLSDETLFQICRVSQEDLATTPVLGDELRLARQLVPPPGARHDERLQHATAILMSALGRLPQYAPNCYNSLDRGWIDRDSLEQVAKQIVGLIWTESHPEDVALIVNEAISKAISLGLIEQKDYDGWRPGMRSGAGWSVAVSATAYGVAKAQALGRRQADATAKPAAKPSLQRPTQDPPWARKPKSRADDGRNSGFCRAALENLKRRAEGFAKQYPSLQHMLVLPEGEYLRVPPPPGCHPLGSSSYHVPPAVTFGESKVAAALPPEDCWPRDLKPIQAVVAEQEFSPYRPLDQKPYRIHLFFGEPAGMAALQALAADLVNLSSDVGRAVFGKQTWDMAEVFFHSPDCIHGKDAEILDAWLCTVHWWAWKAVDSPIHTQPRVVFGGSAIPADRRDHAVDEKLSFSILDCDIFAATVATIDLFFRFFKQPPDLVWLTDYPPEPRPEENAPAGNAEKATSDSHERPQTRAAAQASGTRAPKEPSAPESNALGFYLFVKRGPDEPGHAPKGWKVFYCAGDRSRADALCRLFTKQYGLDGDWTTSTFEVKPGSGFSADERVLLEEELQYLQVYGDPDITVYDPDPPPKEMHQRGQYFRRAESLEQLLVNQNGSVPSTDLITEQEHAGSGGVAVNTADGGIAVNTQHHGVAVNTGMGGTAVSTGDHGIAVSTVGAVGPAVPDAAADGGNWVFDDLPDGEVRARNRRLCEQYASLNLEDMLLLCYQWRQMAIRFTDATKRAGKYHGRVVHDDRIQEMTRILETAIVSRQMEGADRLSRCLRRPDDHHLHHALAALDVLEAKVRAEASSRTIGGGTASGRTQPQKLRVARELIDAMRTFLPQHPGKTYQAKELISEMQKLHMVKKEYHAADVSAAKRALIEEGLPLAKTGYRYEDEHVKPAKHQRRRDK